MRKIRNAVGYAGAVCMAAVLAGTGCAAGETELASQEQTELRVVYASGDANWKACLEYVAELFMEEYPDISVELYTPGNRENRLYSDQLKVLYAEDEFYDVLELREPGKAAGAGILADIPESVEERIAESFVQAGGGKYVPIYQMNRGIIYNRDVFRRLGLEEPVSYDAFLDCCQTLLDAGYRPLTVGGEDLWHMEFWGNFLFENYMLDEEQQVVWTEERAEQMLSDFRHLYEAGYVAEEYQDLSDNQTVQEIAAGNAVMLQTGAWMLPQIRGMNPDLDLGFFYLAGPQGRCYAVRDISNCWGISQSCAEDEEKYRAAADFLTFFYSEDVYGDVLDTMSAEPVTAQEPERIESEITELVERADREEVIVTDQMVSSQDTPGGFRNTFNRILKEAPWGDRPVEELAAELTTQWEGEK